ncbi:SHOCT domain-containing protein [Dankookia rubra]|uniref:SHOCT domain-containing protein n=1 Tax=Dankookia rubra TaxID=1442381 RepID=A0A4V3A9K0_9PROT|nr:SHOCT domain-containing protein [Dankookia rubra]TDH59535.1 SHOCT domain-containing protein [Dankookia rubra]
MQELTPAAQQRVADIAARNGVSQDAALTLLRAVADGGGGMAQFSHPEFGGMGQWSRGGMIMVGDMFNTGLRHRVDNLCNALTNLLREMDPFVPGPPLPSGGRNQGFGGTWWPDGLGSPASSGAQDDMRYAYFPAARRLAVQQDGQTRVYDTAHHAIFGVSQQQGGGRSLSFASDHGTVRAEDLQQVDGPPPARHQAPPPPQAEPASARQPAPVQAPPAGAEGDVLATIEKLADLRARGILTDEEFSVKKAELLGRL